MCGIVGYIGHREAADILLNGLQRLEYRGYDSAGVAVLHDGQINVLKSAGKVKCLSDQVYEKWDKAFRREIHVGIAHTRWATHGPPTDENAHPHLDDAGKVALVHNGIIENYAALRRQLETKGHTFHSDTDSEVLSHLIGEYLGDDLLESVCAALRQVEGTFGIAMISERYPGYMVVARRGSPIVIGVAENEIIVASDASAIVSHTRQVIYLDDNDIAVISPDSIDIRNTANVPVNREVAEIDWDTSAAEKNGYDHFMLKEIFEQPEALRNTIRGRLDIDQGTAILSGLNLTPRDIVAINRFVLVACGTSFNAGLVGEYFFEDLVALPAEVEQAAEFRYRNPIIGPNDMVMAISQSGETADTLAAVREANQKGALIAGLCNTVGSTIARESGRGVYLHAGPEIGVASTKAFTSQVTVLLMMALKFGRCKRLSRQMGMELCEEINRLPEIIQATLEANPHLPEIAKRYAEAEDFFFIGRGYLYPVALEGALKLKEISYIHAEGYHAAELKHGPIALLEEKVPVVALLNDIPGKEKMIGNVQECMARKSPVIAVATEGDDEVGEYVEDILWVPKTSQYLAPITTVVVLQLLSYYIAKFRGCEIDQPRNLAKSVTVE
jgi:glucosamine--fructose-6-phosphate aminotransferase (isomerizing)